MEIDLELPSCEPEKSEVRLDSDVEVGDGITNVGQQDEEEPVNSISSDLDKVSAGGSPREPCNGLEFESKEEAYSFYREYACSVGFGITIKASRRSKKSGKFIDIKVACSRFGTKRGSRGPVANPRECMKTDCKAGIHMKRKEEGKWVIHGFVKEHNHEIYQDDCICAVRGGKKKQPVVVARQKKGLQLALDDEDVQLMLDFFTHMKEENRNFFYSLDLDDERRLKNVLWVDAKGRHEYRNFCDVVFFDTFYVVNKYRIPIVTVVGVDHRFEYILFGCALIGEATSSSVSWLMRTWLKAVGGQAPRVVITDQEKFLREAVSDVFPDARHCFCLWHIFRRMPGSLGSEINQDDFTGKFNKCIFQSWTSEQFERTWWEMVDEFELRENVWVRSLYEYRKSWVPIYMEGMFLAGMSTPERSKSIASSFDRYICPETTFKELIELCKKNLEDTYGTDVNADFETRVEQSELKSHSSFEKQMSSVYTDEIFKMFQVEVLGIASCHLQKRGENDGTAIFQVDDSQENQRSVVTWREEELQISCLCRSFEYKGFLCRHALLVLQVSGISTVPSHYILKRWTKEAKAGCTDSELPRILTSRLERYNELCRLATKLGEVGSSSLETYRIALEALKEVLKNCADVNNSVHSTLGPNMSTVSSISRYEENRSVTMGNSAKKMNTSKKRKGQPEPEKMTTRKQDCGFQMEQSRVDDLNNCVIHQQVVQRGLDHPQARALDGYYTAQHGMQGVLNSVSPTGDGFYIHQQEIPGQLHSAPTQFVHHYGNQLGQLAFRVPIGCINLENTLQDMGQSSGSSHFHSISSNHFQDQNPSR